MSINTCLLSDSYKFTHSAQYPPGTTKVYSYFESRGGRWPEVVFFGLQYILQAYLTGERITIAGVREAEEMCKLHFGNDTLFNAEGWRHIVFDHNGRIPLRIKAVPEGMVVPGHNVLMTVENTCPRCYWVTNFFETLLVQAWYPITVATQSREIKRVISGYLEKTGDPAGLPFKLHDFGFRGVSSVESAGIGGAAHLTQFMGTDTFFALKTIRDHYAGCDAAVMPGFSIPASEHSTITSWGGPEHEVRAFQNMLEQYPTGLMACVSDSYDIRKACAELWGEKLKDKVIARDGVLVVRPDSGEPISLMVHDVVRLLGNAFGYTWNAKGFKVLNPKVRVIQGDGVNKDSIADVLHILSINGWSADNVAFGMGGALLQKLNRDDLRMAFKCSYVEGTSLPPEEIGATDLIEKDYEWRRDVYKDPITDKSKASKRGRLALVKDAHGTLHTQRADLTEEGADVLQTVFEDGEVKVWSTLSDVRARAAL